MSDATLERRCRRLVRAYPEGGRADEVLTTLLETSAGRRAPRLGDALDVLRHGLAARLRSTAPGTRYGRWGDAAAVAVVTAVVLQAATAAAVTVRGFVPAAYTQVIPGRGIRTYPRPMFFGRAEAVAATVATLLAVGAAAYGCLGRVRVARWLTATTALAGGAAVLAAHLLLGQELTFRSVYALGVAVLGAVVAVAVLGTGAVARAATLAPRWWWGTAAVAGLVVAVACSRRTSGGFVPGRVEVVLLAYAAQGLVLLLLALPLARARPAVLAGTALVALPMVPYAALALETYLTAIPRTSRLVGFTAVAWVALVGVAALASRRGRAPD